MKALSHGGISSMVRKAVKQLDDKRMKSKIELLEEFSSLLREYDVQLGHVSGNLNQVVKRANQLSIGGVLSISFLEKQLYPQIIEVHKEIIEVKRLQKSIFRKILNMK